MRTIAKIYLSLLANLHCNICPSYINPTPYTRKPWGWYTAALQSATMLPCLSRRPLFLRTFLRRLTPRIFCDTCPTAQAFSGCTRTEATAAGGCGLTSLAFLLQPAALSLAWPHTPSPRASLLRQHELLHLEELRSRQLPKHAVRCSNSFVSAMHCNCHPGAGQTLTLQNGCAKEKTQPHRRLTAKPPSIFCRSSGKLIRTHAHVLSPESSCARRSLRLNVAPLPATCPLRVRGL